MTGILLFTLFLAIALYAVWTYALAPAIKKSSKPGGELTYFLVAAGAAFLVRIILAAVFKGHETDMGCFDGWSSQIFKDGIPAFYASEGFHDYPPGYMYVLYIVGAIKNALPLSGGALWAIIKLPAILFDIAAAYVVYRISSKNFNILVSLLFAALWLFNPVSILNSSLWGQVDGVYTLFALLMLYFITEKKMTLSYFMFAICLFIKPQAFIFAPVLIGGFIENVILDNFSINKLLKNIGFGIGAIALIFVLALPFGLGHVVEQYTKTLASYPYATVNAFNVWGLFGQNWVALTPFTSVLGYVFLTAISVYTVFVVLKSKNESKYYFSGALIVFLTYMLSTKMHERYAYPAVILLLIAVIYLPNIKMYASFGLITLSQFFNAAWVLFVYNTDINKYYTSPVVNVCSLINVILCAGIIYISYAMYVKDKFPLSAGAVKPIGRKGQANQTAAAKKTATKKTASPKALDNGVWGAVMPKIKRFDLIAMAVITVVYASVALFGLGDMHAAQSSYNLKNGAVTIDLGSDKQIDKFNFYLGSWELNENRKIDISAKNTAGEETFSKSITSGSVFCWNDETVSKTARYITLSTTGDHLTLNEVVLTDKDGNVIEVKGVKPQSAAAVTDEQNEYAPRNDSNSTYFDEIYHARTAYEFLHGLPVYEWTHPPLGKVIISIGIKIFGMNPFGWRIMGTLFGILMVPIIYLFALRFLKKSWLAVVTCLLFTFDFMHFAQTRIATIDVYVTFFIILMYYFIYRYCTVDITKEKLGTELKWLALCGVATAFAIASKWTGLYAASGIFIIWLITFVRRCIFYYKAEFGGAGQDGSIRAFNDGALKKYIVSTVAFCVGFFVVVPLTVYLMSYIPYLGAPDSKGLATILQNQEAMLTYHGKTVVNSTHAFSSHWYEWIIMKRPIWFYSADLGNGIKEGISSFGNPLVWWMGIPAFFYLVFRAVKYRDKNAIFLTIAYLAQLVWWIPVTRITFIYHYFPCVPFIVMMIGYSLLCIYNEAKNKKAAMYAIFGYTALVIVLFVMFYPVLSGAPVSVDYVKHFLKWFDSWVLI